MSGGNVSKEFKSSVPDILLPRTEPRDIAQRTVRCLSGLFPHGLAPRAHKRGGGQK